VLDPDDGVALHAASQCDLRRMPMHCRASAVLGPPGRVFHVSADAVYVWTASWRRRVARPDAAFVVRNPLELVEGALRDGRVQERRCVDFAPRTLRTAEAIAPRACTARGRGGT
jgi:hypothetical protein